MDINNIINDSIHYPLSDYKKFLILGLPNLILSILFFIFILQALGLDSIADLPTEDIISSPIFGRFIATTLVFFIALIIGLIIIEGIQLSVIRETINGNDYLPNLDLSRNFVDGLKCMILSIGYMLVPTLIYLILVFASAFILRDNSLIVILVLTVLFVIAAIFLTLIYVAALGRLAQTNSLGEALKVGNVYEIARNIGLTNIFLVLIFSLLLNLVISLISSLLEYIPLIGFLISYYVFYNYFLLVTSRSYGLLYKDCFEVNNNYRQNITEEQINGRNIPHEVETTNYEVSEINENHPLDFQPKVTTDNTENTSNLNKCGQCGYPNKENVNFCSNCGNKL